MLSQFLVKCTSDGAEILEDILESDSAIFVQVNQDAYSRL